MSRLWHHHPGVRSGGQLTRGERYADKMRNGMGSWAFVFASLVFLGIWMLANKTITHFDAYPFILLNLVLSCVAALQGAILLIAAKRSDQVSSELAQHDYETNTTALAEVRATRELAQQIHDLAVPMRELLTVLVEQRADQSNEGIPQ